MITLVVFLGNYGSEYSRTRHNAAWLFSESLGLSSRLSWQQKFRGQYALVSAEDIPPRRLPLYFLKPETYMNASGESIGEISRFFKIKPEEILIIHDELELPLGTVGFKWSGGLGGHNGLRSAKLALGTPDFWRLRIGIGRPTHTDIAGYVLSPFLPDEQIVLSQIFPAAEKILLEIIASENPEQLIPKWKKIQLAPDRQ